MINKQKQLKIVNPLLGILLLNQALSGMLHDILPHDLFEVIHSGGWGMVILAFYHVYLNWSWVASNLLSKSSGKKK